MLGEPKSPITPAFRVAGKIERVGERLRGIAAFDNRGKIEDG